MSNKLNYDEEFLAELHEVSARLHDIAIAVCAQKVIVDRVVDQWLEGIGVEHLARNHNEEVMQSVRLDISDAEERRDNDSGNTNAEDIANGDSNQDS